MALSKILPASQEQYAGARNLIINGACTISQRGTSFTSVTDTAYHVDRFETLLSGLGTWTISQSTTAPTGFSNSLKYECTTANASPAAGNFMVLYHKLEGQNLQHLKKGTASAESVTLSFWVRSNKTGTYQVNLNDNDNTRLIGSTYSISTADTWEHKTITYSGDTTGALDNDNALSLFVEWWLASGTTFSTGAVPTSWETLSNADRNAGGTVNLADSTSNNFYITGVQLEVGEATPFEHRSFGDELARCQRYYWRICEGINQAIGTGTYYSSTALGVMLHYPVAMRTAPSKVIGGGTNYFRAWRNGGNDDFNGFTNFYNVGETVAYLQAESADGISGTAGQAALVQTNNASAYVDLDAEL